MFKLIRSLIANRGLVKNMPYPEAQISRTLELSTGHLRDTTAKLLDQGQDDLPYDTHPFGYTFYVDKDLIQYIPYAEVVEAIRIAQQLHCEYVRYDGDGPILPELQLFDW